MNDATTSNKSWFPHGALGGVMLFAALNALSWFWLSEAWSDLCGATQNAGRDAIGFPIEIWREGSYYGAGWIINYPIVAANLLVAAAMAYAAGRLAQRLSPLFASQFEEELALAKQRRPFRLTFSVRGLLVATTIVAVFLGVTRMLGVSPELLGAIYFVGPLVLILIAMAPSGLGWEQRIVILVAFAMIMLAGSVFVGTRLGMEFDRVLFGVFICWVPQSVFAAAAVLIGGCSIQRKVKSSKDPNDIAAKSLNER